MVYNIAKLEFRTSNIVHQKYIFGFVKKVLSKIGLGNER
jgi:hypothetical protein